MTLQGVDYPHGNQKKIPSLKLKENMAKKKLSTKLT